ncbi:MAG: hypothetical protein JWO98_148 [Frankiales bacterium]|nr:hypothetical protein [Frankiales bacterium]
MICRRCAHAADNRLSKSEHCDTTGGPGAACFCQHRPSQRPAATAKEQ